LRSDSQIRHGRACHASRIYPTCASIIAELGLAPGESHVSKK
jgi:hypothetical protein